MKNTGNFKGKKRTPGKYEPSYKAKKTEEDRERQFKRELGIKARYKKILRKENVELKNDQQPKSSEENQGSHNNEEPRNKLNGWSVSPATPVKERRLRTSGWNITASPSDLKPVKAVPKGWKPVELTELKSKSGMVKLKDWTISVNKEDDGTNTVQKSVAESQVPDGSFSRDSEAGGKKSWEKERKGKGPGGLHGKPSSLKKAHNELMRKEHERAEKAAMYEKRQREREVALKNRKQKRLEKFKVISQKTPKGQPVMKGRMQLLLQKIQSSL